eukprot:TRINITY_DN24339_c0_g1_i1.p1 TRINITY_DN24339_c0_g1~~TRINITY_DN24339_c0_g1_i1.p1  ORF type:complete len:538 (-),score=63.67 TRINITY_DN24339_c0_g1_i1:100-1608(-)
MSLEDGQARPAILVVGEGMLHRNTFMILSLVFTCLAAVTVGTHQGFLHFDYGGITFLMGAAKATEKPPPTPTPTQCQYTPWGEWNECSQTCGGMKMRARGVHHRPTVTLQTSEDVLPGSEVVRFADTSGLVNGMILDFEAVMTHSVALSYEIVNINDGDVTVKPRIGNNYSAGSLAYASPACTSTHESSACKLSCEANPYQVKFVRSYPGKSCEGAGVNVLRPFVPVSTSDADAIRARDRCESFCRGIHGCWGCSVHCGQPCQWNAIQACGKEKDWKGKILGDITRKQELTSPPGVCADKPGFDGNMWADGMGVNGAGYDCSWYASTSKEHACGHGYGDTCCEKFGSTVHSPQTLTAKQACCACGGGDVKLKACMGDGSTWNGGYGGCSKYSDDRTYCSSDRYQGLTASQVCPQCGACVQEPEMTMDIDGLNYDKLDRKGKMDLKSSLRHTFAKDEHVPVKDVHIFLSSERRLGSPAVDSIDMDVDRRGSSDSDFAAKPEPL